MWIARNVLTGTGDPILAAREPNALRFAVNTAEDEPDFICFVAIDSETDSLPVGSEREQWSSDALSRREKEIADASRWASTYGRQAFENVVARFGDAG